MLQSFIHRLSHSFTRRSFALNELDRKLHYYINYRNGIFVEAGANDGIDQSNTLYFEKYLGWKGLLIEADPRLAERCRVNRPDTKVKCALLGSQKDKGHTKSFHFCGLMSTVEGAMPLEEQKKHLVTGSEIQNIELASSQYPIQTLSDILSEEGVPKIDLLSLDVEGYEKNVLEGMNLQVNRPKHILVEVRNKASIDALLLPFYEEISQLSHHDYLYKCRSL